MPVTTPNSKNSICRSFKSRAGQGRHLPLFLRFEALEIQAGDDAAFLGVERGIVQTAAFVGVLQGASKIAAPLANLGQPRVYAHERCRIGVLQAFLVKNRRRIEPSEAGIAVGGGLVVLKNPSAIGLRRDAASGLAIVRERGLAFA